MKHSGHGCASDPVLSCGASTNVIFSWLLLPVSSRPGRATHPFSLSPLRSRMVFQLHFSLSPSIHTKSINIPTSYLYPVPTKVQSQCAWMVPFPNSFYHWLTMLPCWKASNLSLNMKKVTSAEYPLCTSSLRTLCASPHSIIKQF